MGHLFCKTESVKLLSNHCRWVNQLSSNLIPRKITLLGKLVCKILLCPELSNLLLILSHILSIWLFDYLRYKFPFKWYLRIRQFKILCLPGAFWLLAELGCGGNDSTSFELLLPLLCVTALKLWPCLSFNVVMSQCRGCFCGSDFQFSLWRKGGFLFPFPSGIWALCISGWGSLHAHYVCIVKAFLVLPCALCGL